MNTQEFNLPEFVLSTYNGIDDRLYITHQGISLIEIINNDLYEATLMFDTEKSKEYMYNDESYTMAFHTCNSEYYNLKPKELLDKAWIWFVAFLEKENEEIISKLN